MHGKLGIMVVSMSLVRSSYRAGTDKSLYGVLRTHVLLLILSWP